MNAVQPVVSDIARSLQQCIVMIMRRISPLEWQAYELMLPCVACSMTLYVTLLRTLNIDRCRPKRGYVGTVAPNSSIWLRRAQRKITRHEKAAFHAIWHDGDLTPQQLSQACGNAFCGFQAQAVLLGMLSAGML